jgi:hypothetical protein
LHSARDTSLPDRTDGKRNAFYEDLKDAYLTITTRLLNKTAPPISPLPCSFGGVEPGLTPQAVIEHVGAAPVAARDKEGAGVGNDPQRRNRIAPAGDMSRVRARPDHDEIVPGDLPAVNTVACSDEFVLSFRLVNQSRIGIVVHGRLTRLRCSSDQNMHGDSGFPREGRQDVRGETVCRL